MRILGLDPGLQATGWGIIDYTDGHMRYIGCGAINPARAQPLPQRLGELHRELSQLIECENPAHVAVEEVFVNKNAGTSLKLGYARAIALTVPALAGLPVSEYPNRLVKQSITGSGRADKIQVRAMVARLLPGFRDDGIHPHDASDALAVAVCHAHSFPVIEKWTKTQ